MTVKNNESKCFKKGDAEPPLAPSTARIYSMRFCPFAERALIYAEKKKLSVEVINVHLTEKPDWYFKKHPKGLVPTYEKDGKVVIESNHIPLFLDDLHPESSVLPTDPFARAHDRILAEQLGQVNTAFYAFYRLFLDPKTVTSETASAAIETNVKILDEAEKLFPEGAVYFGGSSPSYSDYMVLPFVERLWVIIVGVFPRLLKEKGISGVDLSAFPTTKDAPFPNASRWPKLTKWFGILIKADEVVAVAQPFEKTVTFFEKRIKGDPDFDYGL